MCMLFESVAIESKYFTRDPSRKEVRLESISSMRRTGLPGPSTSLVMGAQILDDVGVCE